MGQQTESSTDVYVVEMTPSVFSSIKIPKGNFYTCQFLSENPWKTLNNKTSTQEVLHICRLL